MSLPLLDAVCKETLRLHPPVPISSRCCQQDDVIPLQHPIKSKTGHTLTEVIIPKGAIAFIGISVVNRSKSIWGSNTREWIPERWLTSSPVTKTRLPGAFSSMMTFMGGERSCIGFRMAFLELKIVLLPAFRFELSSGDVVWHLGATLAPFVQGKDGAPDRGPKMPMRLSLVGTSAVF
ncbi:cytochrome P450 [Tricholoma matsutake]|nr:cytochrome P450 [Tricholoma matsutake 945]